MFDIRRLHSSPLARLSPIIATISALSLETIPLIDNPLLVGSQNIRGSGILLSPNGSIQSSALEAPLAQCSATQFGADLSLPSCQEAIEKFDRNETELIFKSRVVEDESFDIGLPYRTISCE